MTTTGAPISKHTRNRLAKAELWMSLATLCEQFLDYCTEELEQRLQSTYDLTEADLRRILSQMGSELENRALRAGYDEIWDPAPA